MIFRRLSLLFTILIISACTHFPSENKHVTQLPTASLSEQNYVFIKGRELTQTNDVIVSFIENFPNITISILNLEGDDDEKIVADILKAKSPEIVICLGYWAAKTAINVEKETPIIFAMVTNHKRYPELRQANVTGIAMEIPPLSLLTQFKMLMPKLNSVAVPFHPSLSAEIVGDAINASQEIGMQLVKIAITNPNDIMVNLVDQKNNYTGLWMLADTKLYNHETEVIYNLIRFSKQQKKPLLVFSETFLKPGAFFSISVDYNSLGSQLALIAKQIVQDNHLPINIPIALPIGTHTVMNKETALLLLGNNFDESIYDEVDKVYSKYNDF